MEGIQVSVEKVGPQSDISIIRVGGYIDTTTSSELERALDSLLKAGVGRVIIDLGSVDYISSAGWGIFISEIKGMRERNGDLKLARMIPDVYEVFELLEFHYILKAFDTIEDAIQDFDKGKGVIKKKKEEVAVEDAIVEPAGIEDDAQDPAAPQPEAVEDKIKQIATDHPTWGASRISKALNTQKYGFVRMSTLSVWRNLRKLNLGDRQEKDEIDE